MDTRRIILCVLLVLCTGCSLTQAVSLDISYRPQPAVLGSSQTRLHCQYSVFPTETFYGLTYLTSQDVVIVEMSPIDTNSSVLWASTAPDSIKSRASVIASPGEKSMDLQFDTTRCEDANDVSYKCRITYQVSGGANRETIIRSTTIAVEAPPKAPRMTVTPDVENVTEYSEMTFRCSGNVGRPAGFFQWYTFNDDDNTNMDNVTDQATQENTIPESGAESCTFRRTSVLTLNVTRRAQGKRLVVRCRVYHPTLDNGNYRQCQDPNTDYCRTSQQIDIQYPVEVRVNSDAVSAEEGKETTLTCLTMGNPLPYLVEWHREGDNMTLSDSNDLTLKQLTLNDTGNYICTAYNTIEGATKNASVTVYVSVDKTTTPSPTTTPSATTRTTGSGGGGGSAGQVNKADTDNLAIIIPVVIVAIVIIVVIIVAIVCVRRRKSRKEVEEPPEKPFNNHAGINAVATRPDIVSNAYTSYDNPNGPGPYKNEDGLTYAELQFDNKPRSRRPLAIDDSHTDYSDVSMPQV